MGIKTGFGDQPGIPVINEETCTVCGLCTRVCSSDTLKIENKKIKIDPDTSFGCIGCGQCMMICPTGSVKVSGRNISDQDLLAMPASESMPTSEQLDSLLLSRRSIRHFLQQEVSKEIVEKIINISASAPMGVTPSDVEILVFQGREKVQEFADDMTDLFEDTYKLFNPITLTITKLFNKQFYESLKTFIIPLLKEIVTARKENSDMLLYDAPLAMLFHTSPYADLEDATIVATYAMIAAQSLGLGTCMIGSVGPVLERSKKLREKYSLPIENKLGLVLIAGYPEYSFNKTLRRKFASVKYF